MSSLREQIILSDNDRETRYWVHDSTHLGFAMTPLFQSFMVPAVLRGVSTAAAEFHLPMGTNQARIYHDYYYEEARPETEAPDPARIQEAEATMQPRFATIREDFDRVVTQELLPMYGELDAMTETIQTRVDAIQALERLTVMYNQVWSLHMYIVMPAFAAQEFYQSVFLDLFPDKTATDAHALLTGCPNQFTEADRALARLAKSARTQPQVRKALSADDAYTALKETAGTQEFLHQLELILSRFGWRVGTSHDFYQKTWHEDPRPALAIIRNFLDQETDFEELWQATISSQKVAFQKTWDALKDHKDRMRFHEAFDVAWAARPIGEDHHFYIDAMLPAKSRSLLLRIAAILVDAERLLFPDDIFFLYRDELVDLLSNRDTLSQDIIHDRRQAYFNHCLETPPTSLGKTPHNTPSPTEAAENDVVLSGISASAGLWQGTARVIRGPEDFSRLQTGDVLVSRTTTPTWSALFAIAGAVVTDSGGILSHAATVAREYRVPCIVATKIATQILHDGETVVVDGNRGTITRGQ